MHRLSFQLITLLSLLALIGASSAQERQLFNGKDLTGWDGNPNRGRSRMGQSPASRRTKNRCRTTSS